MDEGKRVGAFFSVVFSLAGVWFYSEVALIFRLFVRFGGERGVFG